MYSGDGAPRDNEVECTLPFMDESFKPKNVADDFRDEAHEKMLKLHPVTGYPYVHLVTEAFHDGNAPRSSEGVRYSRRRYIRLHQSSFHDLISPTAERQFSTHSSTLKSLRVKSYQSYSVQIRAAVEYLVNYKSIQAVLRTIRNLTWE